MSEDEVNGSRAGWWNSTRSVLWLAGVVGAPILFVALAIDGLDSAIDRPEILKAFRFAALVAIIVPLFGALLIGTAVHFLRARSSAAGRVRELDPRFRKVLFVGICCLLWGGAMLILGEMWSRLAYQARLKEDTEQKFAGMDRRKVCEAFHPKLWDAAWKSYRPGAKVAHTNGTEICETSINSLGFRGDDDKVPTADNFVIACLGGSTTVNGRTNDETYPSLLEKYLREDGWDVRVVNCGVSSMKTVDYGMVMSNLFKGLMPDLVLEYNAVNDICVSLIPKWQGEMGGVKALLLRSQLIEDTLGRAFVPADEYVIEELRRFTLTNLKELAQDLSARGIPLFVSSFVSPDPDETRYRDLDFEIRHWWTSEYVTYADYRRFIGFYNELIRKEATENGFFYIPFAETMRPQADDFLDICHLTQDGIDKKARAMAKALIPELKKHAIGERLPRLGN
ncbi:MAG: SGNH/GDSL hydrolase family protein [Limisphaerales bacterium]